MPASASQIFQFSTESLPARDRFPSWADEFGPKLGHSDFDSPERLTFASIVTCLDMGGHAFMRLQGSPALVMRRQPSQLLDAGIYPLHLLFKLGVGTTTLEQDGRVATIKAHEMTLIDSERAMRLSSEGETNSWIFGISEQLAERWVPNARQVATRTFNAELGWASMLSGYLLGLDLNHLQRMSNPLERQFIADHIMSMFSFMLWEQGAAEDDPSVVTKAGTPRERLLLSRMRQWIRDNYGSADIGAQKLATEFNVSTRYVHKVFASAGQGSTFLNTVQDERLQAARRLLGSSGQSGLTIAEVAFRCGFSDPAYFGSIFRKKFGMTPGQFARTGGSLPAERRS